MAATGGAELLLEFVGVAVGIGVGVGGAALMDVEFDAGQGRAYSRAGVAYATLWIAVVGPGCSSPTAHSTSSVTSWVPSSTTTTSASMP